MNDFRRAVAKICDHTPMKRFGHCQKEKESREYTYICSSSMCDGLMLHLSDHGHTASKILVTRRKGSHRCTFAGEDPSYHHTMFAATIEHVQYLAARHATQVPPIIGPQIDASRSSWPSDAGSVTPFQISRATLNLFAQLSAGIVQKGLESSDSGPDVVG